MCILSKATIELYGQSCLSDMTNTSLVSLSPCTQVCLQLASADKTIRLWRGDKQIRVFEKHTDVVRGLCEIPNLGFASCGNDAYTSLPSTQSSSHFPHPYLCLVSSTSGPKTARHSSNSTATQTSSTPSPSSPPANSSPQAKTEV